MPNYFRFIFSLLVLLFWQVAYVEKRELYGHFPSVRLDWTHEEGREECNNDNNELAEGEVNKVSSDEKQYSFLAPKRSRFKLTTLNWRTIERRRIRPATGCWKEEKKTKYFNFGEMQFLSSSDWENVKVFQIFFFASLFKLWPGDFCGVSQLCAERKRAEACRFNDFFFVYFWKRLKRWLMHPDG